MTCPLCNGRGFTDLFIGETLTPELDAVLTQDGRNASLRDAVVRADLLSGFAGCVAARRRCGDAFSQVSPLF